MDFSYDNKFFIWLDDEPTSIELVEDDFKPIYDVEVGEVTAIKIISESGLIKLKELETKLNEYLRINHKGKN